MIQHRDQQGCVSSSAGVEEIHKIPTGLSKYEEDAIKAAIPELGESIKKGVEFVQQSS